MKRLLLTLFVIALTACAQTAAPTVDSYALETRVAASIVGTQSTSVPTASTIAQLTDTPQATNTIPPTGAAADTPIIAGTLATLGQRTKAAGCVSLNALPDPACTPGAVFPNVTAAQICTPGYSKSVRDVSDSTKAQVYAEYGVVEHVPGQYQVDHLISLELGGSNDIANLWPEPADPRPGFHEKDTVENRLHDEVCSGAISLQRAQVLIAANWLSAYVGATPNSGSAAATATPAIVQSTPTAASQSGLDIHVISLTSPILHGKSAALTIQTAPGASCQITVSYKSGPSKAKDLDTKTADSSGQCSWTWTVGASTTPGTWSISVSANLNGQSKSQSIPFVVQ